MTCAYKYPAYKYDICKNSSSFTEEIALDIKLILKKIDY